MSSCFPSSSLALLPLQPFAIVRTVLVQGGWWYCAITSHNQCLILEWHNVLPTNTVLILNSMCLLYIHMYIYICFNWAICHHQIYFKFPWQLSTSCTLSHWKHLSGRNECPTKMFLLRINKQGFQVIVFSSSAVSGQLWWWLLQEDPVWEETAGHQWQADDPHGWKNKGV